MTKNDYKDVLHLSILRNICSWNFRSKINRNLLNIFTRDPISSGKVTENYEHYSEMNVKNKKKCNKKNEGRMVLEKFI